MIITDCYGKVETSNFTDLPQGIEASVPALVLVK
jgi:hypothetical protein